MKRLVLACTVLSVFVALTTPAQALPICFKWVSFCDGVQIDREGIGGAQWYHWDCANNSPMDVRHPIALPQDPMPLACSYCPTCSHSIARSLAPNGPGNYFFLIDDNPLDGNLDMNQGIYPNPMSCWIDDLQYNLQIGQCVGLGDDGANIASTQ